MRHPGMIANLSATGANFLPPPRLSKSWNQRVHMPIYIAPRGVLFLPMTSVGHALISSNNGMWCSLSTNLSRAVTITSQQLRDIPPHTEIEILNSLDRYSEPISIPLPSPWKLRRTLSMKTASLFSSSDVARGYLLGHRSLSATNLSTASTSWRWSNLIKSSIDGGMIELTAGGNSWITCMCSLEISLILLDKSGINFYGADIDRDILNSRQLENARTVWNVRRPRCSFSRRRCVTFAKASIHSPLANPKPRWRSEPMDVLLAKKYSFPLSERFFHRASAVREGAAEGDRSYQPLDAEREKGYHLIWYSCVRV